MRFDDQLLDAFPSGERARRHSLIDALKISRNHRNSLTSSVTP
jgi:hypothetical protein